MSERLNRSARPVVPDPSETIVNAMTVDVEDYFHVSAFDRIVSQRASPRSSAESPMQATK